MKLLRMTGFLVVGAALAADAVTRLAPMPTVDVALPWLAATLYFAHQIDVLLGATELAATAVLIWALIGEIGALPHLPQRPIHRPL